jgi:hypothetical protein
MFGRKRREAAVADPLAHVDPGTVPRGHAAHVASALESRRRWQQVAGSMREGAVQSRLVELGAQVDAGVLAVWDTVQRMVAAGDELDAVVLELGALRSALDELA